VGAGVLGQKEASLIGVGRSSFAYPDALKDLMKNGYLDEKKVCISCSGCSELMRFGSICGCIIHNKGLYLREYQKRKKR
jgi:2,4-dienoyl-CoA reductase-like NADH-dependent reductase (Old Yellow Enzyme family)